MLSSYTVQNLIIDLKNNIIFWDLSYLLHKNYVVKILFRRYTYDQ